MPIARWTIGDVYKDGFSCLKFSIKTFAKLYPEFDLHVCYNSIKKDRLKGLDSLGCKINYVEQMHCEFKGKESIWKYTPPRLAWNDKELFIDNDIVFFNRVPAIDEFLAAESFVLCEDIVPFYGRFSGKISKAYNAGIFGIPAHFDIKKELLLRNFHDDVELNKADEQGLTVLTILPQHPRIIKQDEIPIIHSMGLYNVSARKHLPFDWKAKCGLHFVTLNQKSHEYFDFYRSHYKC